MTDEERLKILIAVIDVENKVAGMGASIVIFVGLALSDALHLLMDLL